MMELSAGVLQMRSLDMFPGLQVTNRSGVGVQLSTPQSCVVLPSHAGSQSPDSIGEQ